jgi:RecB family exonuclease
MSEVTPTGLTLVLGPANSGKLGRVREWWQQRLARQPLVVVPTAPDAHSLSAEMAERWGAVVGQSLAVTFDGLVRRLLGRSPQYVSGFDRALLASHLLYEHPPGTPGFSARFPGTTGVTARILEQLGDSGRAPDDIARALSRWGAADDSSASLAADLLGLYKGYVDLRDRLGLTDRSDAAREALSAAAGWGHPLALYGFTSFTLAQRALVAALARSTEVLLVLDHERAGDRGLTTREELAVWERAAISVEDMPAKDDYLSPEIGHLERHFMDDAPPEGAQPPPEKGEGGEVRFLLASGQRNEAELAAQEVAGLLTGGMDPGDIAVVVRSTKAWGRLLADTLALCGIPCQVEERLELGDTAFGYALLTGLRAIAADDAVALLAYLRSPFSGVEPEEAADIQAAYLRRGQRGVAALIGCADEGAPGAVAVLEQAVKRGPCGALLDLDAVLALGRHMLVGSYGGPAGDGEDQAGDARAYRAFQSALARLAAQREAGALPSGALRAEVLLPAMAHITVPSGPVGSPGAIQVLTVQRARARRFSAVLVLGLVEGEFPGRGERPALLTGAQRARLDGIGGRLFLEEPDQEEALFVWALSRARSVLMLSARDADEGGGYAAPSHYWTRCRALLGREHEEPIRRTLSQQVYAPSRAPSRRHYLRACAALGIATHPDVGASRADAPAWRRSGGLAHLESKEVLRELSETACFSPSAIETYLRCPFAWFISRVVGAESVETLVDERLVGELLHSVLRDAYRQFSAEGLLPLRGEKLARANEVVAVVVDRLTAGEGCPGDDAQRRVTNWRLRRLAAAVFAMEAGMEAQLVTVETEMPVGGDEGVDIGGVAVRGRIDRVDAAGDGELFIVDYKSGSAPKRSKIGTAEGLQLPLYMLALGAERPGSAVVGGAYLSPSSRERTGVVRSGCEDLLGSDSRSCRVTDDDEFDEFLTAAVELAKEAAEGIKSGVIAPPPERDCPAWCELGPVCRARLGSRRW